MLAHKGYLVTEIVRLGREQMIELPPPIDASAMDAEDQKIIQPDAGGFGGDASTVTAGSGDQASQASPRTNRVGDLHCYNYGKTDHWVYKCPDLNAEQQAQLHMHIEAKGEEPEEQQGGHHQLLNVSLMQGDALLENWAYLDGCLMVTAFKSDRYLEGIRMLLHLIKINCNVGVVVTNKMEHLGNSTCGISPTG
jgi:hypothetical protein